MIKLYEHLVSVLAQAVIYFVERHNCRSLIKELIIEIIETDIQNESQDTSNLRAFSGFIVEIASEQPQLVLPCVNLLIHSLTGDVSLSCQMLDFLKSSHA